ncbi:hypothetical protein Dimus_033769 [Dionaea muscipula]
MADGGGRTEHGFGRMEARVAARLWRPTGRTLLPGRTRLIGRGNLLPALGLLAAPDIATEDFAARTPLSLVTAGCCTTLYAAEDGRWPRSVYTGHEGHCPCAALLVARATARVPLR